MGRWAQRRRCGSDNTGPPAAFVVSVVKNGTGSLKWTFNVPVTSDSIASPQLRDDTLGGFAPATGTVQNGANAVTASYPTSTAIGNAWSIVATPTHLTNPNGGGFIVPQSGTVA